MIRELLQGLEGGDAPDSSNQSISTGQAVAPGGTNAPSSDEDKQELSLSDQIMQGRVQSPGSHAGHGPALPGDSMFDHAGWPMISQNVFGGVIQVGVPVTGVISEDRNFHQFSLTIPSGHTETFGLTLVITASTDEEFEIFFAEYFYTEPWIMSWNDFYEHSEFVEINGRTMTITYPGYDYFEGTFYWEFNCPEYQWGDGPEDPNPSDLKLHFSFFLDPDAECAGFV